MVGVVILPKTALTSLVWLVLVCFSIHARTAFLYFLKTIGKIETAETISKVGQGA